MQSIPPHPNPFIFFYFPQTSELSEWQRRVSALKNKCDELDDSLAKVQKDYMKSQEQCSKLQRDLRENVAQKEDQVLNQEALTQLHTFLALFFNSLYFIGGTYSHLGKTLFKCAARIDILARFE